MQKKLSRADEAVFIQGFKAIVGLIYVTDIIDWREISHHVFDQ